MLRQSSKLVRPIALVALGSLSGCQINASDVKVQILNFLQKKKISAQSPSADPCRYGDPSACSPAQHCAFSTLTQNTAAVCVESYSGSTPFLRFPISPERKVTCNQGIHSLERSHRSVATYYAIDLATAPDEAPAKVFSSSEGVALVYQGCTESKASKVTVEEKTAQCKNGFGTHVRVLSPDGFMVLYAGLAHADVQDGQAIHLGDIIGTEGESGFEKNRHLHFSVHFRASQNWLENLSYYRLHPGELPPSIPFETQYCDPAEPKECHRIRSRVERIPCQSNSPVNLRADWRN